MEKQLENLTILISSCDKYEDLWEPFFKLLKKYGNQLTKCPIVLNTESKQFSYDGLNISCPNNYKSSVEWGRRLRTTLETITTDYVLFLLDDFFLQKPANCETIAKCIKWLDNDREVGAFNFVPIEPANKESAKYKNFCYMPVKMQYRFNAQAGIWRKDVLYNSILDIESPWDWEVYGNQRNQYIYKNCKLYAIKYGEDTPYDYNFVEYEKSSPDNIIVHSAIMRGKWDLSCIEECFKENGIEIDYSLRGLYKPNQTKPNKIKDFILKITKPIRRIFFKSHKYKTLVYLPIKEHKKKIKANKKGS